MQVISVGKEAAPIEKGQKVLFSDINAYEVWQQYITSLL
jgi:hypothetical protein